MADPIKFTDEEIKSLVELRDKYNVAIGQFGQLYIERMKLTDHVAKLNEAEQKLQNEYIDLQKQEDSILGSITAKYGEGSLDISSGTFIPKS